MQNFLQELIIGNLFAFLLIFMRFGLAMMIMPAIGDSFVSVQVRLLFALAISFVLTPVLSPLLPAIPGNSGIFIILLLSEAFIGLFIGTIMRIMVSALDTAGTIVSLQAGFSNATLFNPSTGSQSTIMSAVYSSLGVTILLVADIHHQMISAIVDSYQLFPATGIFPDTGSISEVIGKTVAISFKIGVQLAIPFLIVGTLMYIGLGLLGRLMPQLQVFFLAMPLQILLSLVVLFLVVSSGILYWQNEFESVMTQSLALR
ncbi:MAG: flagellar biosynthetic protein FliR [Alphaproteobacteria bacterium]|nr:flagellar biosynthetic protein FliR [Alphaproteobacteria bacterium]